MCLKNNKNIKKLFYFHEKLKLYAFSNFKTFIYYIYMYLIQLKVMEVIKSSNEPKFIESMSSHPHNVTMYMLFFFDITICIHT